MVAPPLVVRIERLQEIERVRLVIEGEAAIVAVLHDQAVGAVEHLRQITDSR